MTGNRSYDDDLRDGYTGRRAGPDPAEREISLGMPTILGIFFALALALAAVFGLGYTLGRRSAEQPPPELTDTTLAPSLGSAPKPSAGMSGQPTTPTAPPATSTTAPLAPVQTVALPLAPPSAPVSAPTATPVPDKPTPQPATSNSQPPTSFIVQVAAVSSQDVADILTTSLQKKGYTVVVRHEPQDKLLHVQIGPFTDRKDAIAMQQRVLADGFNAIVK